MAKPTTEKSLTLRETKEPLFHTVVWLATSVKLGKHIGIEQKPAHRSMGRP